MDDDKIHPDVSNYIRYSREMGELAAQGNRLLAPYLRGSSGDSAAFGKGASISAGVPSPLPPVATPPAPDKPRRQSPRGNKSGLERLPAAKIRTKEISWEVAHMLATTRRKRIGDFSVGGFVAALPGSLHTLGEFRENHAVPDYGHLAELGLLIAFGTGVIISLIQYREKTSRDILEETFPEIPSRPGRIKRLRLWWREAREDMLGPLDAKD